MEDYSDAKLYKDLVMLEEDLRFTVSLATTYEELAKFMLRLENVIEGEGQITPELVKGTLKLAKEYSTSELLGDFFKAKVFDLKTGKFREAKMEDVLSDELIDMIAKAVCEQYPDHFAEGLENRETPYKALALSFSDVAEMLDKAIYGLDKLKKESKAEGYPEYLKYKIENEFTSLMEYAGDILAKFYQLPELQDEVESELAFNSHLAALTYIKHRVDVSQEENPFLQE